MAKKSMILKQQAEPKFSSRKYIFFMLEAGTSTVSCLALFALRMRVSISAHFHIQGRHDR